jgi:hypothetical protein
MNLDALPYTSFLVLAEFSVGSLIVCVLAEWRGRVAPSFVKFSAAMVSIAAAMLVLNSAALDPLSAVGGYTLEDGLLPWVRIGGVAFLLTTLPYTWLTLQEQRRASRYAGSTAICVGSRCLGSWPTT